MTSSTVTNSFATSGSGGIFYYYSTNYAALTLQTSTSFTTFSANQNGGAIYMNTYNTYLAVKSSSSMTTGSAQKGAGLYVTSAADFLTLDISAATFS